MFNLSLTAKANEIKKPSDMKAILDTINSIGVQPRINPTEIYNEGWMTRLLVHHSIEQKLVIKGIDFGNLQNWTSEGLISSPFVFAKTEREGYTHADMALGDFSIDYSHRGEIKVNDNARFFGIIEAKMGSNLSQGTTTVPIGYNQASRNVACIAFRTSELDCEIFFGVVAPRDVLVRHQINAQLKLIEQQIDNRFALYDNLEGEVFENREAIMRKVRTCNIWSFSYEEWIDCLTLVVIVLIGSLAVTSRTE
jgi:hypothetical protein